MITIVTHNGVFHADDVFAVAAARIIEPTALVQRTRDPKIIESADIVIDVGGVHDDARRRFDHHQEGRAGARPNGILYSSFGLLWKVLGSDVVRTILGHPMTTTPQRVVDGVDEALVQCIDAVDNGQALYPKSEPCFEGAHGVSVSSVISGFNPTWDTPDVYDRENTEELAFHDALRTATAILINQIKRSASKVVGEHLVTMALLDAATADPRVILLENGGLPWMETVVPNDKALYVVFPATTGTWMVQCVPTSVGSFEKRRALPEAWAGKRDEELAALTGVEDAVFCHVGRFICGAGSKESALRLANLALE